MGGSIKKHSRRHGDKHKKHHRRRKRSPTTSSSSTSTSSSSSSSSSSPSRSRKGDRCHKRSERRRRSPMDRQRRSPRRRSISSSSSSSQASPTPQRISPVRQNSPPKKGDKEEKPHMSDKKPIPEQKKSTSEDSSDVEEHPPGLNFFCVMCHVWADHPGTHCPNYPNPGRKQPEEKVKEGPRPEEEVEEEPEPVEESEEDSVPEDKEWGPGFKKAEDKKQEDQGPSKKSEFYCDYCREWTNHHTWQCRHRRQAFREEARNMRGKPMEVDTPSMAGPSTIIWHPDMEPEKRRKMADYEDFTAPQPTRPRTTLSPESRRHFCSFCQEWTNHPTETCHYRRVALRAERRMNRNAQRDVEAPSVAEPTVPGPSVPRETGWPGLPLNMDYHCSYCGEFTDHDESFCPNRLEDNRTRRAEIEARRVRHEQAEKTEKKHEDEAGPSTAGPSTSRWTRANLEKALEERAKSLLTEFKPVSESLWWNDPEEAERRAKQSLEELNKLLAKKQKEKREDMVGQSTAGPSSPVWDRTTRQKEMAELRERNEKRTKEILELFRSALESREAAHEESHEEPGPMAQPIPNEQPGENPPEEMEAETAAQQIHKNEVGDIILAIRAMVAARRSGENFVMNPYPRVTRRILRTVEVELNQLAENRPDSSLARLRETREATHRFSESQEQVREVQRAIYSYVDARLDGVDFDVGHLPLYTNQLIHVVHNVLDIAGDRPSTTRVIHGRNQIEAPNRMADNPARSVRGNFEPAGTSQGFSRRQRNRLGLGNCFNCGEIGHIARNCPIPLETHEDVLRDIRRQSCSKCGKQGHSARYCPSNLVTRGELQNAINRLSQSPRQANCSSCARPGHNAHECPLQTRREGLIRDLTRHLPDPIQVQCDRCGRPGHNDEACPLVPIKCLRCGKYGHTANVCLAVKPQNEPGKK